MVYLDLVMVLNFAVDLLLLMGANGLSGFPTAFGRCIAAAAVGGIYGGICMLPGFAFLGSTWWRLVILAGMSVLAFGWDGSALRRGILFVLLSMALGGIALSFGQGGWVSLLAAAAALSVLCLVGFRGRAGSKKYIRAELTYGDRKRVLTALCDTGNMLRDPISSQPVLIVGADVARELLGLTDAQLSDPISTVASAGISGLRLIPYRAVGQPGGMLLALSMDRGMLEGKQWSKVVAFAPQELGMEEYQALAGGVL